MRPHGNDLVRKTLAFYLFYARFQFHFVRISLSPSHCPPPTISPSSTPFINYAAAPKHKQKCSQRGAECARGGGAEARVGGTMEFVFDFIKVDLNNF